MGSTSLVGTESVLCDIVITVLSLLLVLLLLLSFTISFSSSISLFVAAGAAGVDLGKWFLNGFFFLLCFLLFVLIRSTLVSLFFLYIVITVCSPFPIFFLML